MSDNETRDARRTAWDLALALANAPPAVWAPCESCHGRGERERDCPECDGSGCDDCDGAGWAPVACADCGGRGRVHPADRGGAA